MQTTSARPTGVTVIAILAIIVGVLGVLIGLLALLGGTLLAASGTTAGAAGGAVVVILGLVLLALAILEIVFGVGAWGLKPWAWTLGVVLFAANLLLSIIEGLVSSNWSGQILGIVLSGVILYYLFTPGVKAAFGKA